MKYFKTWVIDKYIKMDNRFGDLAKDMKRDKSFPITKDKEKMKWYLIMNGACPQCLEVFEEAYEEYEKSENYYTIKKNK